MLQKIINTEFIKYLRQHRLLSIIMKFEAPSECSCNIDDVGIYRQNEIIREGFNQSLSLFDPTAHAKNTGITHGG